MSTFVENLKYLRKERNLTQEQLANLIQSKKTSIINIENKGAEPTLELLISLSQLFKISIDELVGNELSPKSETTVNIYPGNFTEIFSLNENKPCWFRYKQCPPYNSVGYITTIQGKGEIEFYDPMTLRSKEEPLYLQFINCTSGDYTKNFYEFFCKYGYLGRTKGKTAKFDIHLLHSVFVEQKHILVSKNILFGVLDTNNLCYLTNPYDEDTESICNYISEELSKFTLINSGNHKTEGYHETIDHLISYAFEMRELISAYEHKIFSNVYRIMNKYMEDIIIQFANEGHSFIYNSLLAFMYIEILFDIQYNTLARKCERCGQNYFISNTETLCNHCGKMV